MNYWAFALSVLLVPGIVLAATTDLTISANDISFSPASPILNVESKIYATVHNIGSADAEGSVFFYDNNVLIGSKVFSARGAGLPEELWITWTPKLNGAHQITVKLQNEGTDANLGNNSAIVSLFVDRDLDSDGIPDSKDDDIDGDGLTNAQEAQLGTDPMKFDTDQDGVDDLHDAYPLDPNRSKKEIPKTVIATNGLISLSTPAPAHLPPPPSKTIVSKTVSATPKQSPLENLVPNPPHLELAVEELPSIAGSVLSTSTTSSQPSSSLPSESATSETKASPSNNQDTPAEEGTGFTDWTLALWGLAGLTGAGSALFGFMAWRGRSVDL